MKRLKTFLFVAAVMTGVALLTSADTDYSWTPFYMDRSELEKSVFSTGAVRTMKDPGKIWIDGTNIYVVERYRGVHVIDNSDSSNPTPTDFIVAPGCMDIAVRGNIMYLDNAVDLVALDLTTNTVTKRLIDFFPEPIHPLGVRNYNDGERDKILVGWIKHKR